MPRTQLRFEGQSRLPCLTSHAGPLNRSHDSAPALSRGDRKRWALALLALWVFTGAGSMGCSNAPSPADPSTGQRAELSGEAIDSRESPSPSRPSLNKAEPSEAENELLQRAREKRLREKRARDLLDSFQHDSPPESAAVGSEAEREKLRQLVEVFPRDDNALRLYLEGAEESSVSLAGETVACSTRRYSFGSGARIVMRVALPPAEVSERARSNWREEQSPIDLDYTKKSQIEGFPALETFRAGTPVTRLAVAGPSWYLEIDASYLYPSDLKPFLGKIRWSVLRAMSTD